MISINNLTKKYNDKIIFDKFKCIIKTNEFVCIVGASGCGKSTLLNIIGQIDTDYDGELIIDGNHMSKLSNKEREKFIRNNINYLFQNFALIDSMTVEENLMIGLEYTKKSKQEKKDDINKALAKVGLSNYENKKVFTLSGGEQQRVALARIMVKPGNIILADEPTGNLDSKNSELVIDILKKLQKDGKTVVVVTHSNEFSKVGDRIINLK